MLARAALRYSSSRITSLPATATGLARFSQRRGYTKTPTYNARPPRRPNESVGDALKSKSTNGTRSQPSPPSAPAQSVSSTVAAAAKATQARKPPPKQESANEVSKDQEEFQTPGQPQVNTEPNAAEVSHNAANFARRAEPAKPAKQDLSKEQEEFQTPGRPEVNTEPSTSKEQTEEEALEELQRKLPDLRQGIPSTFGSPFDKAQGAASLKVTEAEESTSNDDGGDGEMPRSAYETSLDKRRRKALMYMYAILGLGVSGTLVYLGRDWDNDDERNAHPDIPAGWGITPFYQRIRTRLSSSMGYYTEPAFPKLLPELDPALQRPMTLVLSLEDLLVHSEWDREHGWRMAKRPGVDYFLRYLYQYFELVIFTSVPSSIAYPVMRKLDPYQIVMWPLYREATRYEKGQYIKDLSYLNRDLSKVILLDTKAEHAKLQPENAIIMKPWKGETQDRDLVALIPFLEYIATMGIEDVRKILESFKGTDIPTEFAKREARVREKFNEEIAAEKAKRGKHSGLGFLGNALGIKASGGAAGGLMLPDGSSVAEGREQGKMLIDLIRERGVKEYERFDGEIRKNGEMWLMEMAMEEKKMQEEQMKSMKSGLKNFFGNDNSKS